MNAHKTMAFLTWALLSWPHAGRAESDSLQDLLRPGAGDSLKLSWRKGQVDGDRLMLRLSDGVAQVERCESSCQPVGHALTLTSGQKEQLLSGLRSANLTGLRPGPDADLTADRALVLELPGRAPLALSVSKSDWPVSADGQGAASVLDDLILKIVQKSSARPLVEVPRSVADLAKVTVQLTVSTSKHPGGLLRIEHGTLSMTPEEGSLARQPRPKPVTRILSAEEQQQLVSALQSLDFDRLESVIPVRTRPAIGDDDGRVVTLHLLPSAPLQAAKTKLAQTRGKLGKVKPATPTEERQARGLRRYMADFVRSPAEPALRLLSGWMLLSSSQGSAAPNKQ